MRTSFGNLIVGLWWRRRFVSGSPTAVGNLFALRAERDRLRTEYLKIMNLALGQLEFGQGCELFERTADLMDEIIDVSDQLRRARRSQTENSYGC